MDIKRWLVIRKSIGPQLKTKELLIFILSLSKRNCPLCRRMNANSLVFPDFDYYLFPSFILPPQNTSNTFSRPIIEIMSKAMIKSPWSRFWAKDCWSLHQLSLTHTWGNGIVIEWKHPTILTIEINGDVFYYFSTLALYLLFIGRLYISFKDSLYALSTRMILILSLILLITAVPVIIYFAIVCLIK